MTLNSYRVGDIFRDNFRASFRDCTPVSPSLKVPFTQLDTCEPNVMPGIADPAPTDGGHPLDVGPHGALQRHREVGRGEAAAGVGVGGEGHQLRAGSHLAPVVGAAHHEQPLVEIMRGCILYTHYFLYGTV